MTDNGSGFSPQFVVHVSILSRIAEYFLEAHPICTAWLPCQPASFAFECRAGNELRVSSLVAVDQTPEVYAKCELLGPQDVAPAVCYCRLSCSLLLLQGYSQPCTWHDRHTSAEMRD
jgi:hypothetical protein